MSAVSTSHVLRYAAAGFALSLGAPVGLLLMRMSMADWPGIPADLRALAVVYAYVAASTAVVFTVFGGVLGRKADRLEQMATEDPLTRLLNRTAMLERLQHERERAARYGQPLSLLMIDVDGMKQINDRNGHKAGDEALLRVAAAMRADARRSDLSARWGGDEFLLAAPSTPPDAAARLAERVRERVASSDGPPLSVSVGVATWSDGDPAFTVQSLLSAADAALYRAKRSGRDRVAAGLAGEAPAP
jgi:diguanylate cyclase (GGDEF)-like protein